MSRIYCVESEVCRAGRSGELNLVRFLLDAGAPVDSCDDNCDSLLVCLLSWNCKFSKREKKRQFIKLLINMGACVNTVNRFGEWTLHVAVKGCVQGFVAKRTVRRLVAAGSFIESINSQGLTPRDIAFNGGSADIGEFLLFHGLEHDIPTRYSFVVPTAPNFENDLEDASMRYINDNILYDSYECDPTYREMKQGVSIKDSFNSRTTALNLESSSGSLREASNAVDVDVECNICMEEYPIETQIFSCFRCRKSLCEGCKTNNVIDTCPFCRADNSKVQYRNTEMEWKVIQSYRKKGKTAHME